jgi:RHS repeat-associated protein
MDYAPFGAEIERVGEPCYTSSTEIAQKFTGKERDGETVFDYFGARYFTGAQGRFTSPDSLLSSGRPDDPQSWNRYAYALNNPLRFTDPFGLWVFSPSGCAEDDKNCLKQYQQNQKNFEAGLKRLGTARDAYAKGSTEYNRIDAAIRAYGEKGDPRVKIAFGALGESAEGRAVPENNLSSFSVLFDPKKIRGGVQDWAITIGHEGTHVGDFSLPMGELSLLSPFSLEYRGYQTSGFVFAGFHMPSLSASSGVSFGGEKTYQLNFGNGAHRVTIWNTGWAEADRATLRDKGITQQVINAYGHPETKPHNPLGN